MNAKKMIQINPNFLKIGNKGKSTRKRRDHKRDLRASIKPNDIKKKLMNKIKDHHHKSLNTKTEQEETVKFTKDFNDQLGYLEKIISSKKKKKRRRRRTKRNNAVGGNTASGEHPTPPHTQQVPQLSIDTPIPVSTSVNPPAAPRRLHVARSPDEPKYGCLKGGIKPTYSEYKRTLKKRDHQVSKPKLNFNPFPMPAPDVQDRKKKLSLLKEKLATPKSQPIKKFKKQKKTVKIYRLGKNKKKGIVGVLIKSGKTRKVVKDEQDTLRSRCLSEVKQYLRKHNLIKAGTTAPEDILRKLYEDSFLAGNIFNKNPENLLHNYLNLEADK